MARRYWLVCLDELQIADAADAALMSGLAAQLLRRDVEPTSAIASTHRRARLSSGWGRSSRRADRLGTLIGPRASSRRRRLAQRVCPWRPSSSRGRWAVGGRLTVGNVMRWRYCEGYARAPRPLPPSLLSTAPRLERGRDYMVCCTWCTSERGGVDAATMPRRALEEKRPGGTPCRRRGSGVGGEGSRSRRGVHDGWRAAISSARRDSTSAGMDAWMLSRARAHSSYRTESAHLVCRCVCAHTCPMPVEPSRFSLTACNGPCVRAHYLEIDDGRTRER